MRILLTNDDGIQAEGIQVLAAHLAKTHQVYVVAPERERSASGHGITMHKPLRVTEVKMKYYDGTGMAVSGTPADCVKLAVDALITGPPDVIVSGINCGANVGSDILYSGTVSAAIEGMLSGYKSIALSLDTGNDTPNFEGTARFALKLTEMLFCNDFPPDALLNVNVPDIHWNEIKGVMITKLGNRKYVDTIERREDPRGRPYFWLSGHINDRGSDSDCDNTALKNKFISITPVQFDLTNEAIMERVLRWNIKKDCQ